MAGVHWWRLTVCLVGLMCVRLSEGRLDSGDNAPTTTTEVPEVMFDQEGSSSGIDLDSSKEDTSEPQSSSEEEGVTDLHFDNGSGNGSLDANVVDDSGHSDSEAGSQIGGDGVANKRGPVESEEPRLTTAARDQHNSATDAVAEAAAEPPRQADINNILVNLQTELQATRRDETRTRSIMMIIQEKQAKQEADLSFLKNEIELIKRDQQLDHEVLTAVQSLVADNVWALNDVKMAQDRASRDYRAMKAVQEQQNATHVYVEERVAGVEADQSVHDTMMRQLQHEVVTLRTAVAQDRNNMKSVVKAVAVKLNSAQLKNGAPGETGGPVTSSRESEDDEYEEEIDVTGGSYARGDWSASKLDEIASTLEEQRNVLDTNVLKMTRANHAMRREMDALVKKTQTYDAQLAKVNTLFYNISLQQSNLENQVLRFQQDKHDAQFAQLQSSLVNLTHHTLAMEDLQASVANQWNTSSRNLHELSRMTVLVDTMAARMRTMEELVFEYRASTHSSYGQLLEQMNKVNDSVLEFHNVFSNHDYHASNVFQEVDTDIAGLARELRNVDNRLAHVEVRSLNFSLTECEKTNSDVMQDMKLTDFHNGVTKLDDEMAEHSSQLLRLDRGLSRLYQDVDEQTNMLRDVVGQVESVVTVLPEVVQLRSQVNSLVEVLPQDCGQLRNTMNVPQEGAYLVKPANSEHTARVYCQYTRDNDTDTSWTLIQRRTDGRLSFARSWREYKDGFGDPDEEFWVGNDNLHYLTTQGDYELRIEMWDAEGQLYIAHYDIFYIDNEDANYRLHINNYHGNATDSMRYSNYMQFSTLDQDNDASSTHCAKFYTSGWWYKHCHYSNLNGRYTVGIVWFNQNYDSWVQMSRSVMKIKPRRKHLSNEVTG